MPLFHDSKCLLIHIPRTAGTSIEKWLGLEPHDNQQQEPKPQLDILYGNLLTQNNYIELDHSTWSIASQIIKPDILNSYFSFAIVRNPYVRLYSEYHNKLKGDNRFVTAVGKSFKQFVKDVYLNSQSLDMNNLPHHTISHFIPQTHFLVGKTGSVGVSRIFKFENLYNAIDYLGTKLKQDITHFPHLNSTDSKNNIGEVTDKNGIFLMNQQHNKVEKAKLKYIIENELDRETEKIIYEMYKLDFNNFGYDREKIPSPPTSTLTPSSNNPNPLSNTPISLPNNPPPPPNTSTTPSNTPIPPPIPPPTPPVFTIVTPTLGNRTLLKLKEQLRKETVPYIHLIMWDTNRCKDSLTPEEVEDERTYSYVMRHPYHKYPNQRNDVWLRAVGTTLTNTPYITFFDDDTWPEENHLSKVLNYISRNKLDYTYVKRRMWEPNGTIIGIDDFEAIGKQTNWGYKLIDNSSIYLKIETARKLSTVFLEHQVYGDDRYTPEFLEKNAKGERMNQVLVNHISRPELVEFFKKNCS